MSEITLYGDIFSQPTRSVMIYLDLSKVSYSFKEVNVRSGENYSEDFTKINPFQCLPAIVHDGYNLWESAAIITYISESLNIENDWYPRDFKIRGRINAYIHWHHQGLRERCFEFFYHKYVKPHIFNEPQLTEEEEKVFREKFKLVLQDFKWILGDTGYAARTGGPTIADVFAYNEFTVALGFFDMEEWPEIKKWFDEIGSISEIKRVTEEFNKYWGS